MRNLHWGATAAVGALAADAEFVAIDKKFKIFALHAGQFDLDDNGIAAEVNVGVGRPMGVLFFHAGRRRLEN